MFFRHVDKCLPLPYNTLMTTNDVKTALDDYINKEASSPECIAFVNSLKVDGNISPGLAVYALAFYSGAEFAIASRGEHIDP